MVGKVQFLRTSHGMKLHVVLCDRVQGFRNDFGPSGRRLCKQVGMTRTCKGEARQCEDPRNMRLTPQPSARMLRSRECLDTGLLK